VLRADDANLEIDLEENAEGMSEEDSILVSPRFAGTERIVSQFPIDGVGGPRDRLAPSRIGLHPDFRQIIDRTVEPDDLEHHRLSR
jgi:hypothetical protein